MFKRILAVALAVALAMAVWIMPAAAEEIDFSKNLIADFDFSNEAWESTVPIEIGGGEIFDYEDNADLGMKVASITTDMQLKFKTTPKSRELDAFTIEFYAKITSDANTDIRLIAIGNAGNDGAPGLWENKDKGGNAVFSVAGGTSVDLGSKFPRDKWLHIVATRTSDRIALYLNGTLVGEVVGENKGVGQASTDSIYIGSYFQSVDMELADFRMYKAAATAEDVAALCAALPKIDEIEGPATPTPPVELPELPEGEGYTLTADEVPAFKAGDEVRVKLNVKDIDKAGLVGLDVKLAYNSALLEYDVDATTKLWESNPLFADQWKLDTSVDTLGEGVDVAGLHVLSDDFKPVTEDNVMSVELVFKALADSSENGGLIAYVTEAMGTLNDDAVSSTFGTGTHVFAAAVVKPSESPSESPSETPSETPSTTPSESPSQKPTDKPSEPVPPTFDAGIISLAAVALSSVVAVKKRKNS